MIATRDHCADHLILFCRPIAGRVLFDGPNRRVVQRYCALSAHKFQHRPIAIVKLTLSVPAHGGRVDLFHRDVARVVLA